MKVAEIMTRGIVAVGPGTPVVDAARLMVEKRISGLPVVSDEGRLVGVFTEGDMLRRAEIGTAKRRSGWLGSLFGAGRCASDYVHSHGVLVGEAMTRDPLTCGVDDDLCAAVEVMIARSVKRLIVVEGGRPVGILSRADVVRAFLEAVDRNERETPPPTEARAEERIRAALHAESWVPRRTIGVEVRDGLVTLTGSLTDPRQRKAIRVVVEREAPGLAIADHMVWIEPYSGEVMELPD